MSQKKNIFNMLYELETGTLIRYGIAYIGFIVILSLCIEGIFIFLYKNAFNRGEKLIKFKKDIELVINKKDALIKTKQAVDQLIKKDVGLKIKDYGLSLLTQEGYKNKIISGGQSITEQNSKPGYKEFLTSFELHDLGLEDVIKIIELCEQDMPVYLNEVSITNNSSDKTLELYFVLATTQITGEGVR